MMKKKGYRVFAILCSLLMVFGLIGFTMPKSAAAEMDVNIVALVCEDSLNEQQWRISNPNNTTITVKYSGDGNGERTLNIPGGGTGIAKLNGSVANSMLLTATYNINGTGKTQRVPNLRAYKGYIKYVAGGTTIYSTEFTLSAGNTQTHTAPGNYALNSVSYSLTGSQTLGHSFNAGAESKADRTLTFTYEQVVLQPYGITVRYLDAETNKIVKQDTATVNPNSTAVYNVQTQFTGSNNKTYKLANGQPTVISHPYNNNTRVYTVYCNAQTDSPDRAYQISVYFVTEDNQIIGRKVATVPVGQTISVDTEATIETYNGFIFKRKAGQPERIVHEASNDTRSYYVVYALDMELPNEAYNITVTYRSAIDGKVLDAQTVEVPVNGTARHSIPSIIEKDNLQYTLAEGQDTEIIHNFNQGRQNYVIYYNQSGEGAVEPYDITVKYLDMITQETIDEKTYQIPVSYYGTTTIPLQAVVSKGDTDFVLGKGQGTEIIHGFTMTRREYVVYYKDADLALDEDEEVIIRELLGTVGMDIGGGPGGAGGVGASAVLPASEDAAVIAAVDAEQAAAEIADQQIEEIIEDNETPLARGDDLEKKEEAKSNTGMWILIGSLVCLAVVGTGAGVYAARKKKASAK